MQYEQALEIIKAKQSLGIKPGLSAVEALLKKMGSPQENLRVIHIAGTNGKGTVANLIASGLSACGLRVGLFTSPWVVDYREQISINGAYIPKERLCEYISLYGGEGVTEFELLTAVMYKYFYEERVDYAVVECGMGGKLDATNALSHPDEKDLEAKIKEEQKEKLYKAVLQSGKSVEEIIARLYGEEEK